MRDINVVLMRSVDNLGQAGDVVSVRKGYFRNYLGPRSMALAATPANLKFAESKKNKLQALVAAETKDATAIKNVLDGGALTFQLRANEKGQLFGSVTTKDIADAIKAHFNVDIERRKIDADAMKTLGKHKVSVRVYPGVVAAMTATIERLKVEGEDEPEAAPAAAAPAADANA